jgi:hypothetical protein
MLQNPLKHAGSRAARLLFKTSAVVYPPAGRFDSGAAPFDENCRLCRNFVSVRRRLRESGDVRSRRLKDEPDATPSARSNATSPTSSTNNSDTTRSSSRR